MSSIDQKTTRGIHYRILNPQAQGPTLVLVMGYAGSLEAWPKRFLKLLQERFRVVVFDNRGTGRSPKPREIPAYAMRELAADLGSVVDAVAPPAVGAESERVQLLGYSLGGCIAFEYALARPERIERLLLLSTTAGASAYTQPKPGTFEALSAPIGSTLEEMARSVWELCMSRDKVDRHIEELRETLVYDPALLTPRIALAGQLQAYRTFDQARPRRLPYPVVVITGTTDPLAPAANSRALARLIQDSELVELEGCDHMPHIERAEELARVVLQGA